MANSVQFKIGSNAALPKVSAEDGTFYLARNEARTNTIMYLSDNGKIIPVNALQSSQDDQGNIIANTYINNLDIQGNKILYNKPNGKTPTELILPNRDGIVVDNVEPKNAETVLWINPEGESETYATTESVNTINQNLTRDIQKKANLSDLGDQANFSLQGATLTITMKQQ